MVSISNDRLILKFDGSKLVSNNSMYRPTVSRKNHKTGRRHAFLRKSVELGAFQSHFHNQIKELGYEDKLTEFKDSLGVRGAIKLTYLVGMPSTSLYYIRASKDDYVRPNDVTNYIKCAEDALGQYIKDDKYNFEVELVKYESTESDEWEFYMILEKIDDYRVYTTEYILDNYINEKGDD